MAEVKKFSVVNWERDIKNQNLLKITFSAQTVALESLLGKVSVGSAVQIGLKETPKGKGFSYQVLDQSVATGYTNIHGTQLLGSDYNDGNVKQPTGEWTVVFQPPLPARALARNNSEEAIHNNRVMPRTVTFTRRTA